MIPDADVDVQDQSMPVWVWIVAAAVALVVIVLTVVLVVRITVRGEAVAVVVRWEPADLGADKQGKSTAMASDAPTQVIATAGGTSAASVSATSSSAPVCQGVGMQFRISHILARRICCGANGVRFPVLFGVIVGCCSIVLMISIGQGISEQNEQMLKSMGHLNDITVTAAGGSGAYDSSGVGMSSLSSSDMTSSDQQAKLDDAAVQRSVAFQASRP